MTNNRIIQYAYSLDAFHIGYSQMIAYMFYISEDYEEIYDDITNVITYLCNSDEDNIFKKDMNNTITDKGDYIQNTAMQLFEYYKEVNNY